jgi:hypothetical protein
VESLGAIYYLGAVDTQGKLLTGKEQYTITFNGSIPYAQAIPPGEIFERQQYLFDLTLRWWVFVP